MNKLAASIRAAIKAFTMRFASNTNWWTGRLGSTNLNYGAYVGDGRANAIVQSVVQWESRTFPEAPPRVMRQVGEEKEPVKDHPMVQLLKVPNPAYSGVLLWMATLADWMTTGNAYWIKQRAAAGRVVSLWWAPSSTIEPEWPDSGTVFVSRYRYTVGYGEPLYLDPKDVVHFRYGFDPMNVRKGLSPLASLLREVYTDDEASNFTASLLRNMGVPGVIISPGEDDAEFDDPAAVKSIYNQTFGGDNRGDAMVMGRKTQIEVLGFSPQQMDLRSLRRLPEERVTAIFGVPAVVVGLGAGLDRSTFNNFEEARSAAYESNIIPTQRLFAADLNTQLLPEFGDPRTDELEFDLSGVRVLQEDQNALHERVREDWKAGVITLNQALAMIGEEQIPDGDVRFVPISGTITPEDALIPEPPAPATLSPADGQPADQPMPDNVVQLRQIASEVKGASDFPPAILRVRERLTSGCTTDVARFLQQQQNRVLTSLRSTAAKLPTDGIFDPQDEEAALRALLEPWYLRSLMGASTVTQAALGVSFTIDDPVTRAFLQESGAKIVNITETTRSAVQDALAQGQAEGESYQQLARRIRDLPAFNRNRARLVARTELGESTNRATIESFGASGVVAGIEVTDGMDWDEPCRVLNGRRFNLIEARRVPMLGHPNCTRAFSPITDVRELRSHNGHIEKVGVAL